MADTYQQRMEKGLPAEIVQTELLELAQEDTVAQEESIEPNADMVRDEPELIQSTVAQAEPDKEKNLRILRERTERAERERDEAMRFMRDVQSKMSAQKEPVEEPEEEMELGSDVLVEGKHLKAYNKKIQKLEKQLEQYQQQNSFATTETRLKSQYPDFDKVVTVENVESLKSQYPELASSLAANPDIYSKAVSTYTLMKKLGISLDESAQVEKERAIKNAAKPRPLISVSPQQGQSPLARANAFAEGLTPELQKQLRQEMEQARRSM